MTKRTNCHCLKCDFHWFSTKLAATGIPPDACAKCHRYDWQQPRIRRTRKRRQNS